MFFILFVKLLANMESSIIFYLSIDSLAYISIFNFEELNSKRTLHNDFMSIASKYTPTPFAAKPLFVVDSKYICGEFCIWLNGTYRCSSALPRTKILNFLHISSDLQTSQTHSNIKELKNKKGGTNI